MEYVVKLWGTGGKSRAALVVSDNFDYGMSRMYQMMMEGSTSSEVVVFKDINKAKEWIEAET